MAKLGVSSQVGSPTSVEVDEGEKGEWRRVIVEMLDFGDEVENFDDAQEWSSVLDAYEERFLWASDFKDDGVTDLPPEHAQHVLDAMRIPNEYYSAIPPDLPASDNLDRAAKRLAARTQATEPVSCQPYPGSSVIYSGVEAVYAQFSTTASLSPRCW